MAAFAATNLDDLFLLVAWFAAGRTRARDIVLGQYLGIGALFAASVAVALLALAVPAAHLAWLGLVPIILGVRMLAKEGTEEIPEAPGLLAVAAVTVANGADNLGVYIPLFATSGAGDIAVYGAVFAVMTALWCAAAGWLVRHPGAGAPLRRHGPKAVPPVLIGIGLWILLR
ncbi:MAG TPA: cadmium resistance transporter [Burkholderiales bacterium]|nr:cadmium resistance transporter [Burkholderiales bacterium]